MSDAAERAKAALEGVTEGPWTWTHGMDARAMVLGPDNLRVKLEGYRDAEFIASARSLVPELIAEVERLRSYKSLPLDMVWQDYYSPNDVLKIRQPLDAEIEQLRAEVERLRAQETLIRELCGGDWIMVANPLNDDKRERAVWAADILAALEGEEA
ncbi:hypothetical protein SimranZ1_81 [Mycobacterium phage SimranZ1]|nr:hypothetical protein SimranZ1_81 [Mycobacterium phage SimranZ1]